VVIGPANFTWWHSISFVMYTMLLIWIHHVICRWWCDFLLEQQCSVSSQGCGNTFSRKMTTSFLFLDLTMLEKRSVLAVWKTTATIAELNFAWFWGSSRFVLHIDFCSLCSFTMFYKIRKLSIYSSFLTRFILAAQWRVLSFMHDLIVVHTRSPTFLRLTLWKWQLS
jgi:hypothetical protein